MPVTARPYLSSGQDGGPGGPHGPHLAGVLCLDRRLLSPRQGWSCLSPGPDGCFLGLPRAEGSGRWPGEGPRSQRPGLTPGSV